MRFIHEYSLDTNIYSNLESAHISIVLQMVFAEQVIKKNTLN